MSAPDQYDRLIGAIEANADTVKKLEEILRLLPYAAPRTNNSEAHVHPQPSTAPMWVCVVLVAAAVSYTLAGDANRRDADAGRSDALVQQAAQIAVLSREVDRLEDYETTAYMLFPEFRKAIEADIQKRKQEQ